MIILKKKNAKQMLNHEELDYCFMNNSKYRYIAVTKANELLAKLLLNLDGNRLCLNWFNSFQTDEKLKLQ